MKNFTRITVLSVFVFFLNVSLQAQETLFGDIFNQLNFEEQTELLDNFDINLDSAHLANPSDFPFNFDSLFLDMGVLDSLGLYLDSIPDLDEDYQNAFDFLGDTLDISLDGILGGLGQLDTLGNDTVITQFNDINDIFDLNIDSLANIGDYNDTLNFNINEPGQNGINLDDLGILQDFAINSSNGSDIVDGSIGLIFDQLFSAESFPSLELAFGFQDANFNYYGTDYQTNAKLIRVGSVPSFDNMWEMRWYVQGSFIDKQIENFASSEINSNSSSDTGIFPFLYDGDFAIMLNPSISSNVRLITSFGMEVGVYVPSHEEFNAFTASNNNVGLTTGIGAQIGSGFSVKTGGLTVYSLATLAYGDVVDKQRDEEYRYNSLKFTAGARFEDLINVRYSMGQQIWAGDNKKLNMNHQLTVGIILQSLNN